MPEIDIQPLKDAATSLQKTLLQIRSKHPDLPKIGVHVTEQEENKYENPTGTSARIVIIIQADNSVAASRVASLFDRVGCLCQSTGEAEVTCDCSNIPLP